jgi:NADH-quinone oxidoreductase subunit J
MPEIWITFSFCLLALIFAFGILLNRQLVPSVFCLFGFLFSIAGVYASLSAHSATFAQILLYVGGVMVLIAFVLFLNPEPKTEKPSFAFLRFHFGKSLLVLSISVITFFYFPFGELNAFFLKYKSENRIIHLEKDLGDTGKVLASEFSFEFEMLGLLMLAGLLTCGWYLKSSPKPGKK